MPLLFISHAVADKPLVDELFDLLQTGCDLRRESIFCSSVEGAGIATGAEFIAWIEEHLVDSSLVVLVLSANFYASRFCLAEMGAAWALKKNIFPIMLPNTARDPGVVFLGRQSAQLDGTGLDDLRDAVALVRPEAAAATARWSIKKERFLERAGQLVRDLSQPQTVDRAQLDAERERAAAAIQLYQEAEDTIRDLREHIQMLENAKDAEEVKSIRAQFEPKAERYADLRKELRSEFADLTRVEVRALYATVNGEEWIPGRDTWDYFEKELEKAVKSKWLIEHEMMSGATAYTINTEHPRLEGIVEKLEELRSVIADLPEPLKKGFERDEGYLLELENWQYWNDALLWIPLLD